MGQMSQEEINVSLFDEVKALRKENKALRKVIADLRGDRIRGVEKISESEAIAQIHSVLDEEEWSPDTLDAIAEVMRLAGYPPGDT